MSIMDMIRDWFKPTPRYKIVHDPEHGYCACVRVFGFDWCVLRDDGTEGQFLGYELSHPLIYYLPTVEAAGERINLHASNRGRKTVWVEPT